jgi:AraC family transcriptional regulator
MSQKELIIEVAKQGASSKFFRENAKLSSFEKGWKGIDYEYHYQNPAFVPEYQSTELVIAIGHSPMLIDRRLGGELRQESTQIGDIQVNPAYSPHGTSWDQPISFSLLMLRSSDFAKTIFDYADPDLVEILPHFSKADPLIYEIAQILKSHLEQDIRASKIYIESLHLAATVHLLENYSNRNRKIADINTQGGLTQENLKNVIDYIHEHYREDFGLTELANITGFSTRYFSELFKISTGFPPFDYLLRFRLTKASQLLLTTKLPIFDVALRAGFSSANNFSRAFRKCYSTSPAKYRRDNV